MSRPMIEGFPKCSMKVDDCFALIPGSRCSCLSDTNFGRGNKCPFYKTEEEFLNGQMAHKDEEEE